MSTHEAIKGASMLGEPGIVRNARELVAEYRRTEGVSPSVDELAAVRSQLRSMAAHPATSGELADRVFGVLLVVDVLVRAAPSRDFEHATA